MPDDTRSRYGPPEGYTPPPPPDNVPTQYVCRVMELDGNRGRATPSRTVEEYIAKTLDDAAAWLADHKSENPYSRYKFDIREMEVVG